MGSLQFKSENSLNTESVKEIEPKASTENQLLKIFVNNTQKGESSVSYLQSNINVKSKISEEFSHASSDERKPKGFKVR